MTEEEKKQAEAIRVMNENVRMSDDYLKKYNIYDLAAFIVSEMDALPIPQMDIYYDKARHVTRWALRIQELWQKEFEEKYVMKDPALEMEMRKQPPRDYLGYKAWGASGLIRENIIERAKEFVKELKERKGIKHKDMFGERPFMIPELARLIIANISDTDNINSENDIRSLQNKIVDLAYDIYREWEIEHGIRVREEKGSGVG